MQDYNIARHIFMKCHFSNCGRFLHIVALEGQWKPDTTVKKNSHPHPPIKIAAFISTYRLSVRKASRIPPVLIHRALVDLGAKEHISVSKLPYTITWTPEKVFVTSNDQVLRVYCIALFPSVEKPSMGGKDVNLVMAPRNTIFLPGSAEKRQVFYFPQGKNSAVDLSPARIILGGETRVQEIRNEEEAFDIWEQNATKSGCYSLQMGEYAPPVGCYVTEDENLGGWAKSERLTEIPMDLGIGHLQRRLEVFNPDDDCDRE